ncbi:hypothetical protein KIN20_030063, partial [Parelaphostrongylus tenuis]
DVHAHFSMKHLGGPNLSATPLEFVRRDRPAGVAGHNSSVDDATHRGARLAPPANIATLADSSCEVEVDHDDCEVVRLLTRGLANTAETCANILCNSVTAIR